MQSKDIEQATLAYLSTREERGRWGSLILTLINQMYESAGSTDALGFLRLVGVRLGESMALSEQPTLEALERVVNERWKAMDWGWVRFSVQGKAIEIVHGGYPILESSEHWTRSLAAVLEGLYEHIFQAQGEEHRLQVRLLESPEGALVFRCAG